MAVLNSSASSPLALLQGVVTFLTTAANFGAGLAWVLVSPASVSAITTECILKGVGDGSDEIYVGMQLVTSTTGQVDIVLNGYAGYDAGLGWREQPGAITVSKLPTLPLVSDTYMTYWLSATPSRFILVVELSTQYEAMYLGLMEPVAIENQYPYPLVVAGSYYEGGLWTDTGASHSVFVAPGAGTVSSLCIRRPDGSWRIGTSGTLDALNVWPTNISPVNTLTVFDDVLTLENVIMYPFLLYETLPVGLIGQLAGIFWIGNREDLAVKDNIVYNDQSYKVFANVYRRDTNSYFAIAWF